MTVFLRFATDPSFHLKIELRGSQALPLSRFNLKTAAEEWRRVEWLNLKTAVELSLPSVELKT
jgi:hypothetical protein